MGQAQRQYPSEFPEPSERSGRDCGKFPGYFRLRPPSASNSQGKSPADEPLPGDSRGGSGFLPTSLWAPLTLIRTGGRKGHEASCSPRPLRAPGAGGMLCPGLFLAHSGGSVARDCIGGGCGVHGPLMACRAPLLEARSLPVCMQACGCGRTALCTQTPPNTRTWAHTPAYLCNVHSHSTAQRCPNVCTHTSTRIHSPAVVTCRGRDIWSEPGAGQRPPKALSLLALSVSPLLLRGVEGAWLLTRVSPALSWGSKATLGVAGAAGSHATLAGGTRAAARQSWGCSR